MALKLLRDNLKSLSWILWLVVAAFVLLVFFEWGGVNQMQGPAANEVAATVGDETITRGELQQQYRTLERYYEQALGDRFNRDMAKRLNLPIQALNQLIEQKILLQEAHRVGLQVTQSEIREVILSYPAFKGADGRFIGQEQYQAILRSNRLTAEDFEASVGRDVLLRKLDAVLAGTAYVPDGAVEAAYREQAEQAQIRFLQLPMGEMTEVEVSDAEVEAYFAEHADDYEIPERRVVDYILLDTNEMRRNLEIADSELNAYYEDNVDQFTREEQVRARHILRKITPDRPAEVAEREVLDLKARIEGGEDFAALATEMSEDEVSAASGGNLRPFGRGAMVPEFEQAAFGAEIGRLVGPVKTDFGYHLIEVQAKTEGGVQPFDQVKAVVRARLLAERVDEMAESKINDVARRIKDEKLATAGDLRSVAEAESLVFETTEPFGVIDAVSGLGRAPAFADTAFSLAEAGKISEPVKIPRGWAILHLSEVQPPRPSQLDEVREDVRRDAEGEARKAAARTRLAEAKAKLESGEATFDALAEELGLEAQESNWFARTSTIGGLGANREVTSAALAMQPGQIGGPFNSATGAVLFEVTDRKTFDAEELAKSKGNLRLSEAGERVQQLKSALVELRRKDMAPQVSQWVLDSFELDANAFGA